MISYQLYGLCFDQIATLILSVASDEDLMIVSCGKWRENLPPQ